MPSKSKYDDDHVYDVIEEDVFSVNTDDEGNPYIVPELHNLGMDHEKIEWIDSAREDIEELFKYIVDYRSNYANSQILEKITFNRFLIFVVLKLFSDIIIQISTIHPVFFFSGFGDLWRSFIFTIIWLHVFCLNFEHFKVRKKLLKSGKFFSKPHSISLHNHDIQNRWIEFTTIWFVLNKVCDVQVKNFHRPYVLNIQRCNRKATALESKTTALN